MSKPKYRRRKILLDRGFQLGLPLRLLGWAVLYGLAFVVLISMPVLYTGTAGDGVAEVYAGVHRRLQSVTAYDVAALAILGAIFMLHSVKVTHRIVGPVCRFKRILGGVREGKFPDGVRLRDGDFLNDLAAEFSSTCATLRERSSRQRVINERTQAAARQLLTFAGDPDVQPQQLVMMAHAVLASAEQLERHIPFVQSEADDAPGVSEFPDNSDTETSEAIDLLAETAAANSA